MGFASKSGLTNSFGQSLSSPLHGSQTGFGQTNSGISIGSTTPFGSQTGTSTSNGASQFSFGLSSSLSGVSPAFGQNTAFGGVASTDTQTSLFGGATQPSQPASGSSIFGSSTPSGASSQPAFSSTGTSALGATSTPALGATGTPAMDVTPSIPAFGSNSGPAFGTTGSALGFSSASAFTHGREIGASSNSGSSSTCAFSFGPCSTITPALCGPTQAFGQPSSAFGSSRPLVSTTCSGGQSSAIRSQTPTSAFGSTDFGQSGFGGQQGGSRVASYSATTDTDVNSTTLGKYESISAMSVYKDKSKEELRWEDYQLGDKGGPLPSAQSTGMGGFSSSATQATLYSPPLMFPNSACPPPSLRSNSNPFALLPETTTPIAHPLFGSSPFGSATSPFGVNSSSSPGFVPYTSLFNTAPGQTTCSPFGTRTFCIRQPSQSFPADPTNAQPTSAFQQNASPFGQTAPFSQSSLFNSPVSLTCTGFVPPPISTPFQFQPPQVAFSSGHTQPVVGASFYGGTPGMFGQNNSGTLGIFGQNNFGPLSSNQSPMVAQAAPAIDPFATLAALKAALPNLPITCIFHF